MARSGFKEWLEQRSSWRAPELSSEYEELERQAADLGVPVGEMVRAFRGGRLVALEPGVWSGMLNTDSNDPRLSFETVRSWRDKDVEGIERALSEGTPLPAPIVLRHGGRHWCVAGNTRLCLSRLMGVAPMVWMIELPGMGMMNDKRLVYGGLALLVLAGLGVSCVASGLLEVFLSSFYVVGIRP